MLARSARVRTSAEFDAIFSAGRKAHGPYLSVRAAPGGSATTVGFLVGRRVDGRATARNQLKRRLRAIVRQLSPTLRPAAIVIIAKPGANGRSYAQLHDELTAHLDRLNVLTP